MNKKHFFFKTGKYMHNSQVNLSEYSVCSYKYLVGRL